MKSVIFENDNLQYLRISFVENPNRNSDLITFPCRHPSEDDLTSFYRGCTNNGDLTNNTDLVFDGTFLSDCGAADNICDGLSVQIECPVTNSKVYEFRYSTNTSVSRYYNLLGCIGYQYIGTVNRTVTEYKNIDMTAADHRNVSRTGRTTIRLRRFIPQIIFPAIPDIEIYEDARPNETALCILEIIDADTVSGRPLDNVQYNITGGNIDDAFYIDNRGYLFLFKFLDRETIESYNLTVQATSGESAANTTIYIRVLDVNDNRPVTEESFSANVSESTVNAFVITIPAEDRDAGTNAELVYSIVGYGSDYFRIYNNGSVYTRVALDRTIRDSYTLVVIISDKGYPVYLQNYTILHVTVVPQFVQLEFNDTYITVIEENDADLFVVQVFAFESETGSNDQVFYRFLSASPTYVNSSFDSLFLLDPTTGVLRLRSPWDAETRDGDGNLIVTIFITVEAYSTKTQPTIIPTSTVITITIQDVNDVDPVIICPLFITVREDRGTAPPLHTFVATDGDATVTTNFAYFLSSMAGAPVSLSSDGVLSVTGQFDYETATEYTIEVCVMDSPEPANTACCNVTINITNIDDGDVIFIGDPYSERVHENVTNGHVVVTVTTVDEDEPPFDEPTYTITDPSVPFTIDPMSGEVTVSNSTYIDLFERTEPICFEVVATSSPSGIFDNATVCITVVLINDNKPIFDPSNYTVPCFYENIAINTTIVTVSATDADGGDDGSFRYYLNAINVPFDVDSELGVVRTTQLLDYEQQTMYTLEVIAQENLVVQGERQDDTAVVNLCLIDLNDNAPMFPGAPYTTFLFENATNGYLVFKFGAVDADRTPENRVVTYRLLNSNSPFIVDGDTLRVGNSSALDYDQGQRVYLLSVEATNPPAIPSDRVFVVTFEITVILNNTNDHSPIFLGPFEMHVCENSENGFVIGTLSASDRDVDQFGTFVFSLVDPSIACSTGFPFDVDLAGDVTVCNVVDYEVVRSTPYMADFVVTDIGGLTDSRVVMILVEDLNDNDPVFLNPTFVVAVPETVQNGEVVYTLNVSDADGPANSIMTVSSNNDHLTPFRVIGSEIEVMNADDIDYDVGITTYTIEVCVTNVGMGSLIICPSNETRIVCTNITINIQEVNEDTPTLLEPFEYYVYENEPDSTVVGCLFATDSDSGTSGSIDYAATPLMGTECTTAFPFQVTKFDDFTACIYFCADTDHESGLTEFVMSVVATDQGSPPLSSAPENYTIFLVDLNDEPPLFNNSNLAVSIEEKHGANPVIQLSITDDDSDLNNVVYFEITVSPNPSPFDVDNNTGQIYVSNSNLLDDDLLRSDLYTVNVTAVNPPCRAGHVDEDLCLANDDTLSTTQVFTISVIDCNDQPPVFSQNPYYRLLDENASNGQLVVELSSSDADRSAANRLVDYVISTPQTPFSINISQFVVNNSSLLDFDVDPTSYSVIVLANNPAGNLCTADTSQQTPGVVIVDLADVNDNDPVIVEPDCFYIPESSVAPVVVISLNASDADSGVNQELTFRMELLAINVEDPEAFNISTASPISAGDCTSGNPFEVLLNTGEVILCGPLDRENITSFIYRATAQDSSHTSPRSSAPVKVCLVIEDVNDNSPVFQDDIFDFQISENTEEDTSLTVFTVTDNDIGTNADITFMLSNVGGAEECTQDLPFAIDNVGNLTLCIERDFEMDPRLYQFQVYAIDGGIPSNSATVNVTVEITDFNDNTPEFNSTGTASVFEGSANELVKEVLALDDDGTTINSNIFYSIVGTSSLFYFEQPSVVGGPARLLTLVALDREDTETHDIEILACDTGDPRLCNTQMLSITVLDIDDNDPIFANCNYTLEEESMFTFVITYTDFDIGTNAQLNFTSTTEPTLILESDGTVISLEGLDRDPGTGGQEVRRFSISSVPVSQVRPVIFTTMCTLTLTDINDNYPIFTSPSTIEIIESANTGEKVDYVLMATDYDKGSNMEITFALVTDDETINRTFDIRPNGDIFLQDEVRLLPPVFYLNISATDGGGLVTYGNFTVVLTDSIPLWPNNETFVSVNEVIERTLITTEPASDRDIQENDVFFYTITSVRPYGDFSVTGNGSVFIDSCCLDREDSGLFTLILEVGADNVTVSDQLTMYITVNDSNDNAPYISPSEMFVSLEETVSSETTIITITAIDIDAGVNSALTYILSGNDSNLFEFDNSGNLRLSSGGSLDYETTQRYVLTVTVTDSGTPQRISNTATVTITIMDVDDNPPQFTQSMYSANVSEDLAEGGNVLVVTISDKDTEPEDITFSLNVTSGNVAQDQFEILRTGSQPSIQGHVVYATIRRRVGSAELDRDAANADIIRLRITATDQSDLSPAVTEVVITLIDIDDSPPSILPQFSEVSFAEGERTVQFNNYSIFDPDSIVSSPITSFVVKLIPNERFSGQSFPLDGGYSDYPQLNLLAGNHIDQLLGFEGAVYPLAQYTNDMNVVRPTEVLISTNIFDPRDTPNVTLFTYFASNSLTSPRHVLSLTTFNYSLSFEISSTQLVLKSNGSVVERFDFSLTINSDELIDIEIRWYFETGIIEICVRRQQHIFRFTATFSAEVFVTSVHLMVGSQSAINTYGQTVLFLRELSDEEILSLVRGGEYFTILPPHSTVSAVENPFTRSLEVTYNGNDNAQSYDVMAEALNLVVYHNDISEPQSPPRSIQLTAQDSTSFGNPSTLEISATLIDDNLPEADLNGLDQPGLDYSTTFREAANAVPIVSPDAIIYDQDSGDSMISMVMLHVKSVNDTQATPSDLLEITDSFPSDTIEFDFQGTGLAFLRPASGGVTSLSASLFTRALIAVTYRYNGTYLQPLTKFLYVTVVDGASKMNNPLSRVTFSLTLVNDPPVLTGFNTLAIYQEAVGNVTLLSGTTQSISDPDSNALSEARVTIENRLDGVSEYLEADDLGVVGVSITSVVTAGKYTLVISGSGSFDAYLSILRTVVYVNNDRDPGNPNPTDRIVSFKVVDDGDSFGTPSSRSDRINVTVEIQTLDDLAIVNLDHPSRDYEVNFTEDSGCISFAGNVEIVDVDGGGVAGARIILQAQDGDPGTVNNTEGVRPDGTSGPFEYIDTSNFGGLGNLAVDNSVTGEYTIVVAASNAQNLKELISVARYCNYIDEPVFEPRLVTVEVTDPSDSTRITYTSTSTISVLEQNDIPIVDVTAQEDVAIRNRPTQIFASDQVGLDDSDDGRFRFVKIYITNPQNTRAEETVVFEGNLPAGAVSVGPKQSDLDQYPNAYLFEVTFSNEGATQAEIIAVIQQIRYQNNATNVNEVVSREVCLVVSDFEDESLPTCVDIDLSAANLFAPSFTNHSVTLSPITVEENQGRVLIDQQVATDNDTDSLASSVSYSISSVLSRTPSGTQVETGDNFFDVDSTGQIFSNTLDAEQYTHHDITVQAEDRGNPILSSTIVVTVVVGDVDDNAPNISVSTDGEFSDDSSPGITIASLTINDPDVTSSNNEINTTSLTITARYLINGQPVFILRDIVTQPDGSVTATVTNNQVLDRESIGGTATLIVSVADIQGTVGSVTITFTITDIPDTPPTVEQRTVAIFPINFSIPRPTVSIGPAMYIDDGDVDPRVQRVDITLAPNAEDASRTLSACGCQDSIFSTCDVNTDGAINLLPEATFTDPSVVTQTIGVQGSCDQVELINRTANSYATVARSVFGPGSFTGDGFTFTFVAEQFGEGYPLIFNDHVSQLHLALWVRRTAVNVQYAYSSGGTTLYDENRVNPDSELFSKNPPVEHHWALVFDNVNNVIRIYFDCSEIHSYQTLGDFVDIPSNIDLTIGQNRLRSVGETRRFRGNITDLYFHPKVLSPIEISCLCTCGSERLVVPENIPAGTTATLSANGLELTLTSSGGLEAANMSQLLRRVHYENSIPNPTLGDRSIAFTGTDVTISVGGSISSDSNGVIRLVHRDDALPEIDANSAIVAGLNYVTTFDEGGDPVAVTDGGVRIRREGVINPSIQSLTITLTNPSGTDSESLLYLPTDVNEFLTVTGNNSNGIVFTGPGIVTDFESAVRSVYYKLASNNPDTTDRTVEFSVVDTGGHTNLETVTTTISIDPINDPPSLAIPSESLVEYTEGGAAVTIAPNVSITDPDSVNLMAATVSITQNKFTGDSLDFSSTSSSISGSYDSATGVLQFSGEASLSEYKAILETVSFTSTQAPYLDNDFSIEANARSVSFVVTDTAGNVSLAVVRSVQFMPINDPPSITIHGSTTATVQFVEGNPSLDILIAANVSVEDPDNLMISRTVLDLTNPQDQENLEYMLLPNGIFSRRFILPILTINDTVRDISGTIYRNTADEPSLVERTIRIDVFDNADNSGTLSITIVFQTLNDHTPVFTQSPYRFSVNENSPLGTIINTVSATDDDISSSVAAFTYSLQSTSVPFSLQENAATNDATLIVNGDLDAEDVAQYNLTVEVVDEPARTIRLTGTVTVIITVRGIPEAPVLDLSGNSDTTTNQSVRTRYAEGSGSEPVFTETITIIDEDVGSLINSATIQITDIQNPGQESITVDGVISGTFGDITFSTSSGNTIVASGQANSSEYIRFLQNITYLNSANNMGQRLTRTVTVVVTDNTGLSSNTAMQLSSSPTLQCLVSPSLTSIWWKMKTMTTL